MIAAVLIAIGAYILWTRPGDERGFKAIVMLGFIAELPLALFGCLVASARGGGRLGRRGLLAAALGLVVAAAPLLYFVAVVCVLVVLGEGRR